MTKSAIKSLNIFIKVAVVTILLLLPNVSFAELGGPTIVEWVGYSASKNWIFFEPVDHSESGAYRVVGFFDLNSSDAATIKWYEPMIYDDDEPYCREFDAKLKKLKSELVDLKPIATNNIVVQVESARISDLTPSYFSPGDPSIPQYKLKIQLKYKELMGELDVTAYFEDVVKVLAAYEIPQNKSILAVITYVGTYEYRGYEVQTPILLTLPAMIKP